MDTKQLLLEHLPTRPVMQLATVAGDQPWLCSVHYVHDENLNMYWLSTPNRRHSRELSANSNAAVGVAIKLDKPVIGMQAEGNVFVVSDKDEVIKVIDLYISKFDTGHDFYKNFVAGTNQHWLYKFVPNSVVLFDEEHFPQSGRQDVSLS